MRLPVVLLCLSLAAALCTANKISGISGSENLGEGKDSSHSETEDAAAEISSKLPGLGGVEPLQLEGQHAGSSRGRRGQQTIAEPPHQPPQEDHHAAGLLESWWDRAGWQEGAAVPAGHASQVATVFGSGAGWYVDETEADPVEEGEPYAEDYEEAEAGEAGGIGQAIASAFLAAGNSSAAANASRPAAPEEEAELSLAEQQLFLDEGRRDVAAGVAALESMYARLDALLAPPTSRRAVHEKQNDTAPTDGSPVQQSGPAVVDPEADVSKHPELVPLGEGSFTLAALLSSGVGGRQVPQDDRRAVRILHRIAQVGSSEAMLALADRYIEGRGVPKNLREGLRRARDAATALNPGLELRGGIKMHPAPVMLRRRWMDGSYQPPGEEQHSSHMIDLEMDLAARGRVEGQRQVGYRMLLGQGMERDEAGAFRQFLEAGRQGDAVANFNLAYMYMSGIHVARNMTKAIYYMKLAAQQDLPNAYNGLGVVYFHGQSVPVNFTKAQWYFERGADLGDPDATYNLGTLHQGGYGVPVNHTLAIELFDLATERGSWRAAQQLMMVHESGFGDLPVNLTRAVQAYRDFVSFIPHWEDSLNEATKMLEAGDVWKAVVYYALLAEQGCPEALLNLGWLLHREEVPGVSGGQAHALAQDLFTRAAAQQQDEGAVMAGHLAFYGDKYGLAGGFQPRAAILHYNAASKQDNVEAMFNLAYMYEHGLGTDVNLTVAMKLYQQAIDTASGEHEAIAPWLALCWLRLRLHLRSLKAWAVLYAPALVGVAAALPWGGAGLAARLAAPALGESMAAAAGALLRRVGAGKLLASPAAREVLAQAQAVARRGGGGWDAAAITLMACALTCVLWRKRLVRRRRLMGLGEQGQRAAGEGTGEGGSPPMPPSPVQQPLRPAEAACPAEALEGEAQEHGEGQDSTDSGGSHGDVEESEGESQPAERPAAGPGS
ncbi:hypothetical protein N2152v2_008925 [Parachlorella kessleri]